MGIGAGRWRVRDVGAVGAVALAAAEIAGVAAGTRALDWVELR